MFSKGGKRDASGVPSSTERSKKWDTQELTGSSIDFSAPCEHNCHWFVRVEAPQHPVQDVMAKEAVWLFVRDPSSLDEKEQGALTAICQASDTASTIYQLVQELRRILHTRSGTLLDTWLEKVRASQIRELQSFVAGIERDKAAVVAGLTLPQNSGLVEGKINKLKLIKRMGYGRAAFALLRKPRPPCAVERGRRGPSCGMIEWLCEARSLV